MEVLFSALILIIGLVIGYFTGSRSTKNALKSEIEKLNNKIADNQQFYEGCIKEKEQSFEKILSEKENTFNRILVEKDRFQKETFERQESQNRDALAELRRNFNETVENMQLRIQKVTAEMLKERQSEFQESSLTKMSDVLTPLNETISAMKNAMVDNTRKHSEFAGIFTANIENLIKQNEVARSSADRLANALSGNNKIQGEWGETVLTELLESQGLKEGIHFDTQSVLESSSGLRPDIILHLDRQRDVVIDSKVSLSSYLSYVNADSQEEKNINLKAHIASIENHVKELVRKDYSSIIKAPRASIGYVIMFVPNTTALLLATSNKPDLWRKAMEKNVYIADEQTLYAALKIVHLTWTQIAQTENHQQVFDLANEMLDRVGKFMEKYVAIGKSVDSLVKSYDEGYKKLREDGYSIPQTCRKLIKLGAKMDQRKNVADNLLGLSVSPDE